MDVFNGFLGRVTPEQAVELMSNSFAARLEGPSFRRAFHRLFKKFTAGEIARFIDNSVAARLQSPRSLQDFVSLGEDAKSTAKTEVADQKHPVVKLQRNG